MTEDPQKPSLRILSVHTVAGGAGGSTVALLLADYFAQQHPAVVVEMDPQKASLVEGLALLAPGFDTEALSGRLQDRLLRDPDFFEDLATTRKMVASDDEMLPDLGDVSDVVPLPINPRALAWRIADGNTGAGRVFVIPASVTNTVLAREDLLGDVLGAVLEGVSKGIDQEEGFRTVVLDVGHGALDLIETWWKQIEHVLPDVDVSWTPVFVVTPQRAELRKLSRLFSEEWQTLFHEAAVCILNKCDSDLGVLLEGFRRIERGDLQRTLFDGRLSVLGEQIAEGAVLSFNPALRWPYGAPFRSDGFAELGNAVKAIIASEKKHEDS